MKRFMYMGVLFLTMLLTFSCSLEPVVGSNEDSFNEENSNDEDSNDEDSNNEDSNDEVSNDNLVIDLGTDSCFIDYLRELGVMIDDSGENPTTTYSEVKDITVLSRGCFPMFCNSDNPTALPTALMYFTSLERLTDFIFEDIEVDLSPLIGLPNLERITIRQRNVLDGEELHDQMLRIEEIIPSISSVGVTDVCLDN